MKAPSRIRGVGLRWRITIAFLGGALAVSALVAVTTYVLAERYLSSQRIDDSVQQALSNVRFATRFLAVPPPTDEQEPTETPTTVSSISELVDLLEARGTADAMIISEGVAYRSTFSISPADVPRGLRDSVDGERVGYAITATEPRQLVFGSPLPGQEATAYFFFPLGDLDQTLDILARVLIGVALGAVALAALAGTRVSARVVDPVRRASSAARQVAEGLLATRLQVKGEDELAALAASFNEMASALEGRMARERRFVGDVSHELRTPLTTLRASTDYLLQHAEEFTPQVRRAAELLSADLDYLQRLVDDLLDLSRVEAGRVDMSWNRLSLVDLTREVVNRRIRTGDHVVRVEVAGDPEDLTTVADKQRLERVVGNLVGKALIHGAGKDVVIRLESEDGTLLVSVEDRGPGVPLEASTRIFERFFKADPARRRDPSRGSGLGLAIARENAHLHGGEIQAFNGRNGGAKFEFRLPRREDVEEAVEP